MKGSIAVFIGTVNLCIHLQQLSVDRREWSERNRDEEREWVEGKKGEYYIHVGVPYTLTYPFSYVHEQRCHHG